MSIRRNRPVRSAGGPWPEPVVLRRGWAVAHARRWNDQQDDAAVRLVRGDSDFLAASARALFDAGAPSIRSSPVLESGEGLWLRAGFEPFQELCIFERTLRDMPPPRVHDVRPARPERLTQCAVIDDASFDPVWRVGRAGLEDAMNATPTSVLLVVENQPSVLAGFAIVGLGAATAFIQRLAVAPRSRRMGVGRSLVRAGCEWARNRGARSIMLNTQPDNTGSQALYVGEGFLESPRRLHVLWRRT